MKWAIWILFSNLTSGQPFWCQGSKHTGVKHYFQTLRFYSMTSELLVLQQRNQLILNYAPPPQIKI